MCVGPSADISVEIRPNVMSSNQSLCWDVRMNVTSQEYHIKIVKVRMYGCWTLYYVLLCHRQLLVIA